MFNGYKINYVPKYASDYKFIVATTCGGELYFYGAYNDLSKARYAAEWCGGVVISITK